MAVGKLAMDMENERVEAWSHIMGMKGISPREMLDIM